MNADILIPGPYNPLNWDRYIFVGNIPVRFTDPTGHCLEDDGDGKCDPQETRFKTFKESYGVTFAGDGWTNDHKESVKAAVVNINNRLGGGDSYLKYLGKFLWNGAMIV